jgi:hypothetical protein
MEQAGSAVQKLKPVFLMSPLSVAQPPTNFFRMVSVDDDDEEVEETAASGKTRDFESVLKLACARGVPEQMRAGTIAADIPRSSPCQTRSAMAGVCFCPQVRAQRPTTSDFPSWQAPADIMTGAVPVGTQLKPT